MSKYTELKYGSTGDEVTALQRQLNSVGNYNLDEDGIYGSNTAKAVKDYQIKNKLTVDGIAGDITLGSLFKGQPISSSPATAPQSNASTGTTNSTPAQAPTFSYTPSDTVTQAEALLQQHMANNQSTWAGHLNDKINQILNREKFSYDLNGDAIYQQYADQYVQQGKMAMMDTIGQAQAMTGGFGNSYAQSAGQQAYQAYLQQLNDVVPELYGMALDQYNQEGQDMYNQASLMAQMDEQEYGRYRDELERLTENARYMSETEYQKALDDFNIKYGAYRDDVSDDQWQKNFDFAIDQWKWQKDQAAAGGSGGGGGDDTVSNFQNAVFSRVDDNGNYVYYVDGKERTYAPGVNPYTGTKNADIQHGTFDNGYQPDNIGGKKLSKTGITDVVNGVTQNVWQTSDGKLWIWDDTQNRYLEYEDDREPSKSASTAGMVSNKNMSHTLN